VKKNWLQCSWKNFMTLWTLIIGQITSITINEQYFILEHNEAALICAKELLEKYEFYIIEANSKFIFALNIVIIIA